VERELPNKVGSIVQGFNSSTQEKGVSIVPCSALLQFSEESTSKPVFARPASLSTLAIRGKETVWSVRAQLYGDIEPRSSNDQRYRRAGDCAEHAVDAGRTAQEYNQRKGRGGSRSETELVEKKLPVAVWPNGIDLSREVSRKNAKWRV
jgi:hypothetical protein